MKLLLQKRTMVILISLALAFGFGVTTSFAQETVKLKGKLYLITIKNEDMNIDDTEGHVIRMSELKGVDIDSGMVSHIKQFLDLVKGNGTILAYTTNHYPDGSKMFFKGQGKLTTTRSPEGKPIVTSEGNRTLIKGTGKWEGFQGGDTLKYKAVADGIGLMEWQGEYTKK